MVGIVYNTIWLKRATYITDWYFCLAKIEGFSKEISTKTDISSTTKLLKKKETNCVLPTSFPSTLFPIYLTYNGSNALYLITQSYQ